MRLTPLMSLEQVNFEIAMSERGLSHVHWLIVDPPRKCDFRIWRKSSHARWSHGSSNESWWLCAFTYHPNAIANLSFTCKILHWQIRSCWYSPKLNNLRSESWQSLQHDFGVELSVSRVSEGRNGYAFVKPGNNKDTRGFQFLTVSFETVVFSWTWKTIPWRPSDVCLQITIHRFEFDDWNLHYQFSAMVPGPLYKEYTLAILYRRHM